MRITVIVNAAAGRRASAARARRRMSLARHALTRAGADFEVRATEYAGHATALAREALDRGARTVVAWGGDGTVNEVASVLAFGSAALGIVPGGSGNGLAYALGVPRRPREALALALSGRERRIDAGDAGGRLFFNLLGFGFDAHVAHLFARGRSRGFRGYLAIVAREVFAFRPPRLRVVLERGSEERRLLLLVAANGTQWGRNARIAPRALLDDGLFDLVAVEPRSAVGIVREMPRLFGGAVDRAPGVSTERVAWLRVSGEAPLLFHVDGEPASCASGELEVRIHRAALRVRA